jgi:hypothetical protein
MVTSVSLPISLIASSICDGSRDIMAVVAAPLLVLEHENAWSRDKIGTRGSIESGGSPGIMKRTSRGMAIGLKAFVTRSEESVQSCVEALVCGG